VQPTRGTGPVPERGDRYRPFARIYYEHGDVQVTGGWFVTAGGRYAVPELRRLRGGRGAWPPVVRVTGAVAGLVLFAVVVGFPFYRDAPAAWLGVAVVALVPIGLAGAASRLYRRPYELWAEYRGATVIVFATVDEKEYGHVTRALIRAREARQRALEADFATLPSAA
jgi:Family of unknown function (DUF6232)